MKDIIQGKNLVLAKPRLKDQDSIYENINDWEVIKWLTRVPWPYKKKDALDFIRKSFVQRRKGNSYPFVIFYQDELVGTIAVSNIDKNNKKAEVGYWLGRRHWGKGIAPEALKLICNFAFRDLKLHRLYADVLEGNNPSCRVLEKAGFFKEGVFKQALKRRGRYYDRYLYGKLNR